MAAVAELGDRSHGRRQVTGARPCSCHDDAHCRLVRVWMDGFSLSPSSLCVSAGRD